MSSLFKNIRSKGNIGSPSTTSTNKKEPPVPLTPLEKLLLEAPPLRDDGRDRFFGLENFGSTCYGSSILQCLFYSIPFREQVINFPTRSGPEKVLRDDDGQLRLVPTVPFPQTPEQLAKAKAQATTNTTTITRTIIKPEDKESQEYKKKQVLAKGPLWALRYDNAANYGMKESLFTCMKDLFEAISMNQDRMGIIAPYKFYEIMRSSIHETWGGSQHQDAHEFLNLLLNSVVDTVEATAKAIDDTQTKAAVGTGNGVIPKVNYSSETSSVSKPVVPRSRWVHEIFEGILTSETKCLACENTSKRDEPFLDLSVDLDSHSSVTACLRRFSQEEMLKEKDKFFCDNCGGLHEAEKRMKIKRLPKVLALHLKRFRYTEDMQRMNKLFHRVTYPEQLRLFNTTLDAEDPDRLYELYAVVIHIGAGPYHGHYVSVIKTRERGWLLFDDELVEPVDKSFVMNFFGEKGSLACAYLLFYQETTMEEVRAEQEAEGRAAAAKLARPVPPVKESLGFGLGLSLKSNGFLSHHNAAPTSPTEEHATAFPTLHHAVTAPQLSSTNNPATANISHAPIANATGIISPQSPADQGASRKDRLKEEKERKHQEKEAAKAEKTAAKEAKAQKKDEESKQRQALEASKKAERQAREKETTGWNFLSAMNNQMSPSSGPATQATQNGVAVSATESSVDPVPSEQSHLNFPATDSSLTRSVTSHPTSNAASGAVSPSNHDNTAGGAFSRFRQTSRSLKHRPKFWSGGATAPSPPMPPTHVGNGHVSTGLSSGLFQEKRSDEYALEDSDTASATGGEHPPTNTIPRSTVAMDGTVGNSAGDADKANKKRTSRFSLRRKGSNMLSFSAGSDK